MALKSRFSMHSIEQVMRDAEIQYRNKIVRVLRYVGEQCVNEAKANGSYQDQTANLRNSIGYVIIEQGKIIDEEFRASARGKVPSRENPIKYGRDLAREVSGQYTDIALIVVSGMKYGAHVEALGRNVLTSAEQLAKIQVPRLLKQLR